MRLEGKTAIVTGGEFPVGPFSGRQRQFSRHCRVSLQRRLGLFDARERRLGQRDR